MPEKGIILLDWAKMDAHTGYSRKVGWTKQRRIVAPFLESQRNHIHLLPNREINVSTSQVYRFKR